MDFRSLIPILFIALAFASCGQEKKAKATDEVTVLKEEVMRYHDEAMAEMSALKKLGTKLYNAQSFPLYETWPEANKRELGQILNQLGDAEKSMWNWMYAYVEPGDDRSRQEKMDYFREELKKVKVVHEKIFGSLERARSFSAKHRIEYADQNQ